MPAESRPENPSAATQPDVTAPGPRPEAAPYRASGLGRAEPAAGRRAADKAGKPVAMRPRQSEILTLPALESEESAAPRDSSGATERVEGRPASAAEFLPGV